MLPSHGLYFALITLHLYGGLEKPVLGRGNGTDPVSFDNTSTPAADAAGAGWSSNPGLTIWFQSDNADYWISPRISPDAKSPGRSSGAPCPSSVITFT